MAIYVLPTFNITVAFWRSANPLFNPPDVTSLGNLSPGKIVSGDKGDDNLGATLGQTMWLRLPFGTDAQDAKNGIGWDICECPWMSGRFYNVIIVDDISGGFLTEHRFAVLAGTSPWPTPFPTVGGFTPIPPVVPPTAIADFNSGGLFNTGGSFAFAAAAGTIGGCVFVTNSLSVPTVTLGAGPDGVLSGIGQVGSVTLLSGSTLFAFPWAGHWAGGAGVITIGFAALGSGIWDCFAIQGLGAGLVNVVEAVGGSNLGPVTFPMYVPSPVQPKIHVAFAAEVNRVGAPTWAAPFSWFPPFPTGFTIGLETFNFSCAIYIAHVGGQFPAHQGSANSGWAGVQAAWLP